MSLTPATQALLETAIQSHSDALEAGEDEKSKASLAFAAQVADDQAKAVALAKAQQANLDLMDAISAIQKELSLS